MSKKFSVFLLLGLAILALAILSGCCTPGYEEIDNPSEYADVIGKTFKTREELLIFGTSKDAPWETIDGYVITEKPGIGGREILSRDPFPVGSVFRVNRIMNWTNWLSEPDPVVEVLSDERYRGAFVELSNRGNTFVPGPNETGMRMNPRLFQSVPE
jgi:hypothetical protein